MFHSFPTCSPDFHSSTVSCNHRHVLEIPFPTVKICSQQLTGRPVLEKSLAGNPESCSNRLRCLSDAKGTKGWWCFVSKESWNITGWWWLSTFIFQPFCFGRFENLTIIILLQILLNWLQTTNQSTLDWCSKSKAHYHSQSHWPCLKWHQKNRHRLRTVLDTLYQLEVLNKKYSRMKVWNCLLLMFI